MTNSNQGTTIRLFREGDKEKIIKFMVSEDFMHDSFSPDSSIIASILDYQEKTSNYGYPWSVILDYEGDVVGFLGCLAMPFYLKGERIIAIQTSSALVSKKYPGNFKKMLQKFCDIECRFHLSVFPVHYIFSSFEKAGFSQVLNKVFENQYLLALDIMNFLSESPSVKNWMLIPAAIPVSMGQFILNKRMPAAVSGSVKTLPQFDETLVPLIEKVNQKLISESKIYPEFSIEMLHFKFGNKLKNYEDKLSQNAAVAFVSENSKADVDGILILKRIGELNRLAIADLRISSEDLSITLLKLMQYAIRYAKHHAFNSILIFGLDEEIQKGISAQFPLVKRASNKRVYARMDEGDLNDLYLQYTDDDINY